MGNFFQTIVDKDAEESEVSSLATALHGWLVTEGIVTAKSTGCSFGIRERRFIAGPKAMKAVEESYGKVDKSFENGLEIVTGRTVFDAGGGGLAFICPVCSKRFEDIETGPKELEAWQNAVGEWYGKQGLGILKCSSCGNSAPVTEWDYDPPWAFANLGFRFWNWPPLKEKFVEEVGKRLGHRVVLVVGKY